MYPTARDFYAFESSTVQDDIFNEGGKGVPLKENVGELDTFNS